MPLRWRIVKGEEEEGYGGPSKDFEKQRKIILQRSSSNEGEENATKDVKTEEVLIIKQCFESESANIVC